MGRAIDEYAVRTALGAMVAVWLAVVPDDARACSPPDPNVVPGWVWLESFGGVLDGVPLEGVLLIHGEPEQQDVEPGLDVSVEVITTNGVPIAGHASQVLDPAGIVWRSQGNLMPGAAYRATVVAATSSGTHLTSVFEFRTSSKPWPEPETPKPTALHLTETARESAHWCCPLQTGACIEECWPTAYEYLPTVRVSWEPAKPDARYVWTTLDGATSDDPRARVFGAPAENYCVTLSTHDLVHGKRVRSDPYCVPGSALDPIPHKDPPPPDPSRCPKEDSDSDDAGAEDAGDLDAGPEHDFETARQTWGSCEMRSEPNRSSVGAFLAILLPWSSKVRRRARRRRDSGRNGRH